MFRHTFLCYVVVVVVVIVVFHRKNCVYIILFLFFMKYLVMNCQWNCIQDLAAPEPLLQVAGGVRLRLTRKLAP